MLLNFSLNNALYQKIEKYDVQKTKPTAATQAPANRRGYYPNGGPRAGIPEELIPTDIIPKERLVGLLTACNDAVDTYYGTIAKQAIVNGDYNIYVSLIGAKYWLAVWFNNKKGGEEVFNYSICLRNLISYKTYRHRTFLLGQGLEEKDLKLTTHDKKQYLYLHRKVSKEDLDNRKYKLLENFYVFSSDNLAARNFYSEFIKRLSNYTKVWQGTSYQTQAFGAYNYTMAQCFGIWRREQQSHEWKPDIDYFLLQARVHNDTKRVYKTPFFAREINSAINGYIEQYEKLERPMTIVTNELTTKIARVNWVFSLYGDLIPLDLLQAVWNLPIEKNIYDFSVGFNFLTKNWFTDNVPVKSFVNMFSTDQRMVLDSVNMVQTIRAANAGIEYKGRWRPREFHDFVTTESWKIRNKNIDLPQDLFPKPVKVKNLTFIQPINTHQLAQWGQAARNCVGSSTYHNGILRKNHFIILGMKNNEVYLTIQARVENRNFRVTQISKTCNTPLNGPEQAEFYEEFSQALKKIESTISDATADSV